MSELGLQDRGWLNDLSSVIFRSALAVHRELGPGLLESVYQQCMVAELQSRSVIVGIKIPVALYYRGQPLNKEYILDILVANEIVLELKAVETILPVHEAQLLTYLKLTDKRLGFLINFNVPLLKQGFRRFVNKF